MLRLSPSACSRLPAEAQAICEQFLRALPPFARWRLSVVRLFGPQARAFDPEAPFDLLLVCDERSIEVKTAVAIARSAVEAGGLHQVAVTVVSAVEAQGATGALARLLQNARREGVDLWSREAVAPAATG